MLGMVKRMREISKNILLLLGVIIIMLLVSELVIRIYYGKKVVGVDEEEKCVKAVYNQVQDTSNMQRYHPDNTIYKEYSPYSGVWPTANYQSSNMMTLSSQNGTTLNAVLPMINVNSQHLRALREYTKEKPNNITRIAVFGDSFTWGGEVPDRFTFPYLIEQLLPNSEVLNYGIEGVGIDVMYERWKYEALNYSPDVVVFTIYMGIIGGDDIARVEPCMHKPTVKVENNKIVITNIPPPSYGEIQWKYRKPVFESYLYKHLMYNLKYRKGVAQTQFDEGMQILDVMLDEMKARSEQDGTYFMVALIEIGNYDVLMDRMTPESWEHSEEVKSLVRSKGIPLVSSEETFKKVSFTPTDYFSDKVGHFLSDGNAYFAQGIIDNLEENGVIPKQKDYYFLGSVDPYTLLMQEQGNESSTRPYYAFVEETK